MTGLSMWRRVHSYHWSSQLLVVGMGPECERLHKRMAELIAAKRSENYSQVIQHIRCRLRFALLKATLVAIRGM